MTDPFIETEDWFACLEGMVAISKDDRTLTESKETVYRINMKSWNSQYDHLFVTKNEEERDKIYTEMKLKMKEIYEHGNQRNTSCERKKQ